MQILLNAADAARRDELPDAPAARRNADAILAVLREHFADCRRVLEIGSGTGQHAVHFAAALPQLQWQTSDRADWHAGIRGWIAAAALPNVLSPLTLDVEGEWPHQPFDAVFSANTLHIMSESAMRQMFAALPQVLEDRARLVIYGPFNYGGAFTSDSNRQFDAALRERDPRSGIRDFETVDALARDAGLSLIDDREMPANNRCLVWGRR